VCALLCLHVGRQCSRPTCLPLPLPRACLPAPLPCSAAIAARGELLSSRLARVVYALDTAKARGSGGRWGPALGLAQPQLSRPGTALPAGQPAGRSQSTDSTSVSSILPSLLPASACRRWPTCTAARWHTSTSSQGELPKWAPASAPAAYMLVCFRRTLSPTYPSPRLTHNHPACCTHRPWCRTLLPCRNVLLGWRDRRPTAKVVGYGLTGRKVGALGRPACLPACHPTLLPRWLQGCPAHSAGATCVHGDCHRPA
jgi:hypothetical protein